MMKSALIKDYLYREIERLKVEVYAAHEKVGVYVPKERYLQEESKKKAMADQIEQMGIMLETNQKQIDVMQEKYNAQLQQCSDLGKELNVAERNLDHTSKMLATTREDLKLSQYELKEKDFMITEQRKADRKGKLNAANRTIVDNFQADLAQKVKVLSSTLASFMARQRKHLESAEEICKSCLEYQDKSSTELTKKASSSSALFVSHIGTIQNVVRLRKANINSSVEEMYSLSSASCGSLDEVLSSGGQIADHIVDDIQGLFLNQ